MTRIKLERIWTYVGEHWSLCDSAHTFCFRDLIYIYSLVHFQTYVPFLFPLFLSQKRSMSVRPLAHCLYNEDISRFATSNFKITRMYIVCRKTQIESAAGTNFTWKRISIINLLQLNHSVQSNFLLFIICNTQKNIHEKIWNKFKKLNLNYWFYFFMFLECFCE